MTATQGYRENLGNLLRRERKEVRLSQQQLADELSVSDSTVSNWERAATLMDAHAHARIVYLLTRRRRAMGLPAKALVLR